MIFESTQADSLCKFQPDHIIAISIPATVISNMPQCRWKTHTM